MVHGPVMFGPCAQLNADTIAGIMTGQQLKDLDRFLQRLCENRRCMDA